MINLLFPGNNVAIFKVDQLSIIFAVIFAIAMIIGFIYSHGIRNVKESLVELGYALCSIAIVFANDWITMIILWEMLAVASWLIITMGNNPLSAKAGFRYILVHMFGGNMLLIGIVLMLINGQYEITNLTGMTGPAFWLILIGVGVNCAIPPLNSWISDAYPEATIGGTVFMSAYTTKVGMYFIIRLFAGSEFLLYFGVFMAIYAALMAMMENDLRRLFSYHIVSQLGYIISSASIGGYFGIDGAACHSFNNILYKGVLMMCAGAVIFATGKRKITDLGGTFKKMPLVSICFLIASLSITGVPFFNGFASKGIIMLAVEESGYTFASIGLTIASVGTLLSVLLKCNYFVFFGKENPDLEFKPIPLGMKIGIVMGTALCVITGILPGLTVYKLLPYAISYNPFTFEHIIEYAELFVGGTIAFYLVRKKMKPHVALSLDFDWIYRKPIKLLVWGLSDLSAYIQNKVIDFNSKWIVNASKHLHKPVTLLTDFGIEVKEKKQGLEDDDVLKKPAGRLVAINMIVCIAIIVIVLIAIN